MDPSGTRGGTLKGHMVRALRALRAHLRHVEYVLEAADARLPRTSRNDRLASLCRHKVHFLLLTRSDLAEPEETLRWIKHFEERGTTTFAVNARTGEGMERVRKHLMDRRAGRVMVVGVPNVGKSSIINRLAQVRKTSVGARPGVTRGKQWVSTDWGFQVLDLPGVLGTQAKGAGARKLALAGILDPAEWPQDVLALDLIQILWARNAGVFYDRYRISLSHLDTALSLPQGEDVRILEEIGRKRGCLGRGGTVDFERAARVLLGDLAKGYLGPLTFETVVDLPGHPGREV